MIKLAAATLTPVLMTGVFRLLNNRTGFAKTEEKKKQWIIGIVFGLFAILSTEFGVDAGGVILNVRDSAPLCAGLFFGVPAGLIAGTIGGVHRWISVYWGIADYTRLACSLATLLAGVFAALLRKRMLENRRPSVLFGFGIGITMEILHMLLVLVTNMKDITQAFAYVERCTVPMSVCNGLAVAGAAWVCAPKRRIDGFGEKPPYLRHDFAFRLMIGMLTALLVTSGVTHWIQKALSDESAKRLLALSVEDVCEDIERNGMDEVLTHSSYWRVEQTGGILLLDASGNVLSASRGGKAMDVARFWEEDGQWDEHTCYRSVLNGVKIYYMVGTFDGGYVCAYIPIEEAGFFANVALYMLGFMEILVYTSLFLMIYKLIRQKVVENLNSINKGLDQITQGKLDTELDVRDYQEFKNLSEHINVTVDTLKTYIKEAGERIDQELEFARKIQRSALPSLFPPYPDRKDFELFASMDAAKEVGGDFYDYYLLDQSTLVILIADVSGKGIPASMFMMTAKTLLKSLTESGRSPEEVFTLANEKLCENNEAGMFVTAWMGMVDLSDGKLTFVNAGHNPPLLGHKDGSFEYLQVRPNLVLAGMEHAKYRKHELQLSIGDTLYLYTDGVTEAMDAAGALYGEERLKECLEKNASEPVQILCGRVKNSVDAYEAGVPQADDITMLSIRLHAVMGEQQMQIEPTFAAVPMVADYLGKRLEAMHVPAKTTGRILIAADEIFSNIIRYSGADLAEISAGRTTEDVTVVFVNNGAPYDPTTEKEPDISLNAEERQIGGLGIFMVRKMASAVEYEYQDGKNRLTLTFALPKES